MSPNPAILTIPTKRMEAMGRVSAVRKALVMGASAVAMLGASAHSAKADSFTTIRAWGVSYCLTHPWSFGEQPLSSTACLEGNVTFGYSTSLGEYGFAYNFGQQTGPLPVGANLQLTMNCLHFTLGIETPGCFSPASAMSGQFFSIAPYPLFDADAQFVYGTVRLSWHDPVGQGSNDVVDLFAQAVAAPEPSTFVLLATGVGALIGVGRLRRRQS